MSAPTALYRRYRPDSFATVIGQEHVTAPLMAALEKNRVNHAYLFSGPRGCGKTTSARILARCLNCAKGPTSHPCGECDSCIELARGGSGSLDVIEIDAASHGGVDDARDLRERATFAPIRDRYKIFIIDEAHMVTSAGFNALLKIVEEPPEHIKFIFATTEPDKVIGTIRSRTHHYPFRLVPPEPLMAYLAQLCEQENVAVAPGVLSLVVRAGGGSVRDSLSVLDQLMAGAGDSGLDYDLAVDLLGYTHSSLLDDVVEALAAADSATVFKSVDRVIQTGHDPRRFVEDLLERFRDLIIVQAMPESAHAILRGTPDELIARMQTQAAQLGAAELSRAADVTNAAFNDMTGASSPRLHLELLGARLLLPSADSSTRGMATRLDQLERRLNYSGAPAGNAPAPAMGAPEQSVPAASFASPSTTAAPVDPASATTGGGLAAVRAQLARAKEAAGAEVEARHASEGSNPSSSTVEPAPVAASPEAAPSPAAAPSEPAPNPPAVASGRSWDDLPTPSNSAQTSGSQSAPAAPAPAQPTATQQSQQQAAQQAPATTEAASAPASSSGIEVIRRAWPEILGSLRNIRMASWVIVNQNVVPQTFDGQELRVGLPSTGLISTFSNGGHLQNLQTAINQVLGLSIQILPVDGEAPKASAEPNPKAPAGSPSPQGEGNNITVAPQALQSQPSQQASAAPAAPAPAAPAPTAPTTASTQPAAARQASVAGSTVAGSTTVQSLEPVQSAEPVQSGEPDAAQSWGSTHALVDHAAQAAQSWGISQPSAPAAIAVAAPAPQAARSQQPMAPNAQVPWDGPTEPSDPWDEPHPDAYPQEDPYAGPPTESGFAQAPAYSPEPNSSPESAANRAVGTRPEPAAPPVHVPPKVSPIAAWTTGWDLPVEEPVAAEPAAPESPRRSEILARQIAAQGTQPQEAPQDLGVSLGQVSRNTVADPGWGSMSEAPDWAQGGTSPAEAAPAGEVAAAQAPEPTEPAGAPDVPFNAALPVAGQPLGASTAYPTPSQAPPQPAAQQPEAPASGMNASEKLSMYQRLSNSSEAQAGRAKAPAVAADSPYVEDVPSPDDVTIEESGVVGQAAVERILGGVLIEERSLNPNS